MSLFYHTITIFFDLISLSRDRSSRFYNLMSDSDDWVFMFYIEVSPFCDPLSYLCYPIYQAYGRMSLTHDLVPLSYDHIPQFYDCIHCSMFLFTWFIIRYPCSILRPCSTIVCTYSITLRTYSTMYVPVLWPHVLWLYAVALLYCFPLLWH